MKKYRARIIAFEAQREDIDAAIQTLHDGITQLEKILDQPAAPARLGAARAFESEAKKRLEEAH